MKVGCRGRRIRNPLISLIEAFGPTIHKCIQVKRLLLEVLLFEYKPYVDFYVLFEIKLNILHVYLKRWEELLKMENHYAKLSASYPFWCTFKSNNNGLNKSSVHLTSLLLSNRPNFESNGKKFTVSRHPYGIYASRQPVIIIVKQIAQCLIVFALIHRQFELFFCK